MVYYVLTRPDKGDPYSPCGDGGDRMHFMFQCDPSELSYELLVDKFNMYGDRWTTAENIEKVMERDYELLSQPELEARFMV
jgi:hypothetical protein